MITTIKTAKTTVVISARAAAARRRARRAFDDLTDQVADAIGSLYEVEDPFGRYELLVRLADLDDQRAGLHPAAHRTDPLTRQNSGQTLPETTPETMPGALAGEAGLYRLAASAELSLIESDWTRVEDLRVGQYLWFASEFALVTDISDQALPVISISIRYGDGQEETLAYDAGERVRTDGRRIVPIMADAVAAGADPDELAGWVGLATTRDRDRRAELLTRLAEHATKRVGGHAAEALHALADAELAVYCREHDHPHPYRWLNLPSRPLTAGFIALLAAIVLVPGLPDLARLALLGAQVGGSWLVMWLVIARAERALADRDPIRSTTRPTAAADLNGDRQGREQDLGGRS